MDIDRIKEAASDAYRAYQRLTTTDPKSAERLRADFVVIYQEIEGELKADDELSPLIPLFVPWLVRKKRGSAPGQRLGARAGIGGGRRPSPRGGKPTPRLRPQR